MRPDSLAAHFGVPLPTPEVRNAQVCVGALEQSARGTRIVSPRSVVEHSVIGTGQLDHIEQGGELGVLNFMSERHRERKRISRAR